MTKREAILLFAFLFSSLVVSGVFWLSGWNFERGISAAIVATLSIIFGCILANLVSELTYE